MPVSPTCMYTSRTLFALSFLLAVRDGARRRRRRPVFHAALLLAAAVGAVHHSRLDRWIVNDWVRAADVLLWSLVGVLAWRGARPQDAALLAATAAYSAVVLCACWRMPPTDDESRRAAWHGSVHLVVCAALLCVDQSV